ncbi:hypothetical protein R3P38DRAFT_2764452 [Favolaschia claudopus]|uniref:Uncharacterized protein n=1 Tax=Favolaschia claudopus TaxID=2862362 RepID=A0AAW0DBY0_9AGAR
MAEAFMIESMKDGLHNCQGRRTVRVSNRAGTLIARYENWPDEWLRNSEYLRRYSFFRTQILEMSACCKSASAGSSRKGANPDKYLQIEEAKKQHLEMPESAESRFTTWRRLFYENTDDPFYSFWRADEEGRIEGEIEGVPSGATRSAQRRKVPRFGSTRVDVLHLYNSREWRVTKSLFSVRENDLLAFTTLSDQDETYRLIIAYAAPS